MKNITPTPTSRRPFHGVVSLVCVLAMLLSVRGVLPLAFATLAWMDGEHRVQLSVAGGESRIVLGHNRANACQAPGHCHKLTAKLLVAFATSGSGDQDADHVLKFSSSECFEETASSPLLTSEVEKVGLVMLAATELRISSAQEFFHPEAERPPPNSERGSPILDELRTVTLLI